MQFNENILHFGLISTWAKEADCIVTQCSTLLCTLADSLHALAADLSLASLFNHLRLQPSSARWLITSMR